MKGLERRVGRLEARGHAAPLAGIHAQGDAILAALRVKHCRPDHPARIRVDPVTLEPVSARWSDGKALERAPGEGLDHFLARLDRLAGEA